MRIMDTERSLKLAWCTQTDLLITEHFTSCLLTGPLYVSKQSKLRQRPARALIRSLTMPTLTENPFSYTGMPRNRALSKQKVSFKIFAKSSNMDTRLKWTKYIVCSCP